MSPFPAIRATLVCDAIRAEVAGKTTILGLYGACPDVEITIRDPTLPVDQLAFLVMAGQSPANATYNVEVQIVAPDGSPLAAVKNETFEAQAGKGIHLGVGGAGFPLKGEGTYTLVVTVDGVKLAPQSFRIRKGVVTTTTTT